MPKTKVPDIKGLNKKELKDYINTNGFFFHTLCDKVTTDEANDILTDSMKKKKVNFITEAPKWDNIIIFRWIASQSYWKWEKSRNGYKYDQNGWDTTNYWKNPIILWQHNASYGWIGKCMSFWLDDENNLNTMFFVDTNNLDERNAYQVKNWYVTAISTWAISKEHMFEDQEDDYKMITQEEAEEKYDFWEVLYALWGMSDKLILVVTKSEMLEHSMVTIWSNWEAIAWKENASDIISLTDWIWKHFRDYAEKYKISKWLVEEDKLWKINEFRKNLKINIMENDEIENEWEIVDDKNNEEKEEQIKAEEEDPVINEETEKETTEQTEAEEETETETTDEIVKEEDKEENTEEKEIEKEAEAEVIVIIEEKQEEPVVAIENTINEVKTDEISTKEVEDKNDNQKDEKEDDSAWKIAIDQILSDFEIKITKMEDSINEKLTNTLKDYISIETNTKQIKDLKDSFTTGIDDLKNELTDKVKALWEDNETIVDTIDDLVNKLKNTIFSSAWVYKADTKSNSSLAKKLEIAKNQFN